jgi:hypothetical protein
LPPLIADFYRTATVATLVDLYFFIQRNCRTRLACLLAAAFMAFIQPASLVAATAPAPAPPAPPPIFLKQIAQIAPYAPTGLVEQPAAPAYVPPPPPSRPYAPAGSYANPYEWGNCTWYVASRLNVPANLGNANTWAARALADGYSLGPPIVGAVAQSTAGPYGHVALVVAVGPGTVTVDEMNVLGLGQVDERSYPAGYFNNYIYF